ncbi:hypothetical protein E2C01_035765 [Portunus trituberculatus]|uniref:Uncharacterized protein n=1 Tax=Portunus trituberculatus TaxID=210409 RepID=A0A5B7F560_PORTR|nr:hypothetical protein [Portunus trituberculatus]
MQREEIMLLVKVHYLGPMANQREAVCGGGGGSGGRGYFDAECTYVKARPSVKLLLRDGEVNATDTKAVTR